MPENANHQELTIQLEQLPAAAINNKHLKPITDNKILTHINNLLPELFQAGSALKNAIPANSPDGPVLYQAIIPAGAKLSESKDMQGAFRGFYQNETGIQGHANFVAVEPNTGTGSLSAAVSSAMSVASMVVGQYYMAKIDNELAGINRTISKIENFQNTEYQGKVASLVERLKTVLSFQDEILVNDELRMSERTNLYHLQAECTKLLEQAILSVSQYAKGSLQYSDYLEKTIDIDRWYNYQKALLDALFWIAKLEYALSLGTVSREKCNALFVTYLNKSEKVQSQLRLWHQDHAKKLGIDKQIRHRKRDGIDGVIHTIPGIIDKKQNFRRLSQRTRQTIKNQKNGYSAPKASDLFQQDVKLIIEGEKLYYLPEY